MYVLRVSCTSQTMSLPNLSPNTHVHIIAASIFVQARPYHYLHTSQNPLKIALYAFVAHWPICFTILHVSECTNQPSNAS